MSEVEKMYKNVGFEREIVPCYSLNCEYFEVDKGYPPFTAEKQILLLQLLAIIEPADYFQFFFYEIKQEWVFRLNMLTELSCESAYIYESRNKNFDECIAGLINIIWQDLTEEEKQQVKEVLE